MERRQNSSSFPLPDGLVRDVEVKRGSGTYMRPITKIYIIYPAEGFADYNGDSPLRGGAVINR